MRKLLPLILLFPLLVSCVGKKKYLEMQYLQQQGQQRERQLMAQLDFSRAQIEEQRRHAEQLSREIGSLENDKDELKKDTTRLQERIRDMERRARSTQEGLASELEATASELAQKTERLDEIEQTVKRRDQRLLEAYAELQDSLQLVSLDDVSVTMRDGRVFITLSDQLLFGGRSTNISKKGEEILALIAAICNKFPDLDLLAVGHTSTDRPARGYEDNWDLSVRRAAAAIRLLTDRLDVSSNQVMAAGKGEYLPLAPNDSAENKQKNRRLELILAPRIDQLYNLLEKRP